MQKKKTRIYAFVMAVILLFTSGSFSAFAAGGNSGAEVTSSKAARIALYQAGDLGAAYSKTDDLTEMYEMRDGTAESALYNGLKNMQTTIELQEFALSTNDALNLFRQVVNANPDLFYVSDELHYSVSASDENVFFSFQPEYIGTASEIKAMAVEFEAASQKVLAEIDDSMTDLEKALFLHDYIVKTTHYDQESVNINSVPAVSHTAYGCLVRRLCVCDGYALAYSYLLKQVGIESHLISGPGHAWNAIKLNGNYYFVDATWDDPVSSMAGHGSDMFDYVGHSYFLLSGDELKADGSSSHSSWDQNITPTDTTYSNAQFRNVTNTYAYYNDNWYYCYDMSTDPNVTKPVIAKTSDPTAVGTTLLNLPDKWYIYNNSQSYYPGYYGGIDVSATNGKLYYTSTEKIYSIDLDADTVSSEEVFTLDTDFHAGYLCGIVIIDDVLHMGIAPDVNAKEIISTLDIRESATGLEVELAKDQTELEFLYSGETYQLNARPIDGKFSEAVSWNSSNPAIATVDSSTGLVTAITSGAVTVTATSGTLSDTFDITIKPAVTGLKAESQDVTINKGTQATLEVLPENDTVLRDSDIVWSLPETENVIKAVTAESEAKNQKTVEGISGGAATVKFRFGELEYTFAISVSSPFTDFAMETTEVTIGIGSTYQAKLLTTPQDAYPVPAASWSSDNEEVATVENGLITPHKAGTATISCTINEITRTITVTVADFIPGDVDGNGNVTAEDALAILKHVAHMENSSFNMLAADCDGKDKISAEDALWVLKKVAHMI